MSPSGRLCDRNATVRGGRERGRPGRDAICAGGIITIAEYGEFALIAAIGKALHRHEDLIVGIGDDAAVLRAPDGRVVATTDMLIEGTHFRREWSCARDIGAKAAARNLADIAAMGARPTALLVSFAGPGETKVAWVLDLVAGIEQEGSAAGAVVAGGDTSSAGVVMLAITALGDLEGRQPVTRSGAIAGDVVAVTGTLGRAAAGLALLMSGPIRPDRPDRGLEPLIQSHRRPHPPYDAGPEAAKLGATSMIDISDGLVADLGHVASASEVQIELRTTRIMAEPVAAPDLLARAAAALGGTRPAQDADPMRWVLTGGDDHALAATFPPGIALPERWITIGQVSRGNGIVVDGNRWTERGGWEHFPAQLRFVAELILRVTRGRGHLLDITTLMPRQRPVGRPRHRAKRQGLWSVRGVRFNPARHSSPDASPLPHEPPPARSLARPSRQWLTRHMFHLVRGAVVTPWFAVSVGIVIATSLTLARPHPALTFPPSVTWRCVKTPCASPLISPAAPGPAINHGVILPLPRHDGSARFAAVKVEYELLSSRHHRFVAVILIVSRHRLGWWQLKFVMYGAKIDDIMWARWQPEGRDGVIVAGSPAPWSASADSSAANEARIVVIGAGTPAWPARCRFDGAICRFHGLPKHAGRAYKSDVGG